MSKNMIRKQKMLERYSRKSNALEIHDDSEGTRWIFDVTTAELLHIGICLNGIAFSEYWSPKMGYEASLRAWNWRKEYE